MPTHKITRQVQTGQNSPLSQSIEVEADQETNGSLAVPDASVDLEAALAIDVSALKAIYLASDEDLTVETNSGSVADDTFDLKAGEPLIWTENDVQPNPFGSGTDVAALFVTNASGADATLEYRILQDSTP